MSIRDRALGASEEPEALLMAAIKAAQSASSALEGLQMSLVLLANRLASENPPTASESGCRHGNKAEIQTFSNSDPAVMCMDCGLQLTDAMHHGQP